MPDILASKIPPKIWGSLDPFIEAGGALGRRVANSTFLDALFNADPFDAYHFFLPGEQDCSRLQRWCEEHHPSLLEKEKIKLALRHTLPQAVSTTVYHCMHLADPLSRFSRLAQTRNTFSKHIFPITGLTHSLSYERYMPEYLSHLWAGVSPRDALVVTSRSASSVMSRIFEGLRTAYGLDGQKFPAPALEQIPLGVDTTELPGPDERWDEADGVAARKFRDAMNLGARVVFVCLSRICPYSKMDLIPLLRAFERAFALGLPPEDTALVIAGWADTDDHLPEALASLAQRLGITVRLCLRPDDATRRMLYASADVFVSPSDNLQETFGLTLAEAGAASLPVIASDFDGYRDIVIDNDTGILVPTWGPDSSALADNLAALWFDNQYHLYLAQQTVVDVPLLAEALVRFGTNRELRKYMGQKARKRVLERFSWPAVIGGYVTLWDALSSRAIQPDEEKKLRTTVHPLRMRYAQYFSGYFSRQLDEDRLAKVTILRTSQGEAVYKGAAPHTQYAGMEAFLDVTALRLLLLACRKPVAAQGILGQLEQHFSSNCPNLASIHSNDSFASREIAKFTLLWALKQDYVEIVRHESYSPIPANRAEDM